MRPVRGRARQARALADRRQRSRRPDARAGGSRAREAVRRQLQTFARELVSSLQFYQNQPGSLGIGEIVITGGTAHLGGLAEELQKLIGVRVSVGDPLTRVKLGRKIREDTSSSARSPSPSAWGSRTECERSTSSPETTLRRRQQQKNQWVVLVPVILAVLLSGALSMMFLSASGKVKDRKAKLAELQAELAAIPTPDASKVQTQTRSRRRQADAGSRRSTRRSVAAGRLGSRLPRALARPAGRRLAADLSAKAPVVAVALTRAAAGRRDDCRRDRVHARRLHLLPGSRRAPARPRARDPRPRQRPALSRAR